MNNLPLEDISRFDILIERQAKIKEKYGDEFPIIVFDPNIETIEKEAFRNLIKGNSSVHLFSEYKDAENFIQVLGISFILIFSSEYNEQMLLQGFQGLKYAYNRRMFDFEEEAFLKDIFKGISDPMRMSLKAYVFVTLLDFMTEVPIKEDEEEVMVMCDTNKMAEQFRQEFTLIWYNPQIASEVQEKLQNDIEIEIQPNNIYTDFDQLWKRLEDYKGPPYHLIFSRFSRKDEIEKIIKEWDSLKDLLGLYIDHDASQTIQMAHENVDICSTYEELVRKIKEGIRTRSKLKFTIPAFATNFDAWDKSNTYNNHHYLRDLINFKNRNQAKEDFIKLARKIYQDEEKELIKFEEDYKQEDIFHWYTRNLIYRALNNCLRISTSDSILYCRLLLKDLEMAIREEYQQKDKNFNGAVYRGAYISADEWDKLQRNIGKEIEMYGFLSTSVDSRAALNFLKADLQNKIFITIIIPPLPKSDEQGFADVSQDSEFKAEKEILFNVKSKFRILETYTPIKKNGCRQLVLLYGDHLLRKFMSEDQPSIPIELTLPPEIKCMICDSKDDLFGFNQGNTEILCIGCLRSKSFPQNTPLLALDIEGKIGANKKIIKRFPGQLLKFDKKVNLPFSGYKCHDCKKTDLKKYYKWISLKGKETLEQCLECFKNNRKTEYQILLSEESPYTLWQESQTEWENADSNFHMRDPRSTASQDQSGLYIKVQEFDLCIDYGKKVFCKWSKKRFRESEKLRINDRLGEANLKLENNQKSMEHFFKGLKIKKAIDGDNFPDISVSYNNIGSVYESSSQHQQALEFFFKALGILKVTHGENHPYTGMAYSNIGSAYESLEEYQKAIDHYKRARDILMFNFGKEHPDIALLDSNLGCVYASLGQDQQALNYYKKALDIKIAIYGEKHSETAISYNNIASLYENLRQYQQALEYHEKGLHIHKIIYEEKHPDLAMSYNNIGSVQRSLGQYQQAEENLFKALEILKGTYGENHSHAAMTYSTLGLVYKELGQHQQAQDNCRKAIDIEEALHEKKHSRTAIFYNNLGSVLKDLEQHQQALKYFFKALDVLKVTHGENHSHTAKTYSNIGRVYQDLGQHQQALENFLKAQNIKKATYGEEHLEIGLLYNNLGSVYQSLEQLNIALDYFSKARDIFKVTDEEGHSHLAESYDNLGSVYQNLEQYEQALDSFKKALDIKKPIYKEEHSEIASSYNNLGSVHDDLKEYKLSSDYFFKALKILKVVFGENHSNTATGYNNIGFASQNLGEYQQALENYQKAESLFEANNEKDHSKIVVLHNNMGKTYASLGQYQKALKRFFKALDVLKANDGENHSLTAMTYINLASAFKNLEQHEKELEYHLKALSVKKVLYEEEDPEIAWSYYDIGEVYSRLGQKQQALDYFQKSLAISESS